MAKRKKWPRAKGSKGSTLTTYAVTICQGAYIECDTCCFTSPVMYEFADGSCICETCLHGMSTIDYALGGILSMGGLYGGEYW
jgi:hypothetical protein